MCGDSSAKEAWALVREQPKNRGVYLAFTGGCAALASSHMTLKGVFFKDLGMAEAIWVIELDRLPLVVGIDAHGNDLFDLSCNMRNGNMNRQEKSMKSGREWT